MTWLEEIINSFAHWTPTVIGAVGSTVYMSGTVKRKIALIPLAGVFSYYVGGYIAENYILPPAFVYFAAGIFGMPFVDKGIRDLMKIDFAQRISDFALGWIKGAKK